MAKGDGTFERMRNFLKSYLKDGEQFKAAVAYYEFAKSGMAEDASRQRISQKDFAMYLRTEVLKRDGLLKRTAHGIYEKRTAAEDRGVTFARGTRQDTKTPELDEARLDKIPITQSEARLDRICEDAELLTARIRMTIKTLQQITEVYPEYALELASYSAGMMKDMDRVATGLSAMMAWCEDHTNEILVAGDVREYLKSDEYGMEFSREMMEAAKSDDEIRAFLIERHRAYVEKCMACEEQGHDWQETADPENGISELDCQKCGELITLSW